MTTITLDLPEDIVHDLSTLDTGTLTELLRQVIHLSKNPQNGTLDSTDALNGDTSRFDSLEASTSNLQKFKLLPPTPLPEFEPPLSQEEWKKKLLAVPSWTDEELDEFEKAMEESKEYMSQWTPRSF